MGQLRAQVYLPVVAALCGLACVPAVAHATYPGRDGLIAYENAPDRFGDFDEVDAVLPRMRVPLALLVCPSPGTLARHYSDPAFAPDGRTFAFSTSERCGNAHRCCASTITVARPDGTIVRALSRLTVHDRSPQFLPSGRQLVFAGRPRRGPYDLYTASVRGTGLRRLTTGGADNPAPCANGAIAYVHDGNIYLLSANHRSHRQIARVDGFFPVSAGLSCSPDSRLIAFVRDRDRWSPGDLYVVATKGGRPRRITSGGVVIGTPAFSPAGGLVALTERHRNTRQWPRPRACPPGQPYSYYLEVVNLKNRRPFAPVDIGCNSAPGGISWQPLHGSPLTASPWHSQGRVDSQGLSAIACPTESLCVASDLAGSVVASSDPTAPPPAWHASDIDGSNRLTDVTCPSATLCVAGDAAGNLVTSTDPGGGVSAWTVTHVDGVNAITSISCASTTLCVAVDDAGNALTSTAPARGAWTTSHIDDGISYECYHYGQAGPTCQPALTAVSCPSTSLCVAVDDAGNRISSSNPTGGASAWSRPVGGPLTPSEAPNGLACPSTLLCVASNSYAGEIVTWNPIKPGAPETFASIAGSSGLGGVACPSSTACFAFSYDDRLFGSADPTGDLSAWATLYTKHGQVTGVACPAVAPCLAVDNIGNLLVGPPVTSAIVRTEG